jgi:hypothetical protein
MGLRRVPSVRESRPLTFEPVPAEVGPGIRSGTSTPLPQE